MSEPGAIGQRLQKRRVARGLTQQRLAQLAEVSIDVIQKLEQGVKSTARITTLHQLAQALDVNVAELLGESRPVTTADPSPDSGLVAIRRAILERSSSAVPSTHEAGPQQSATYAWGCYWAGQYDALGSHLPTWLSTARATHQGAATAHSARALADAYAVASSTLVHLGETDLAYLAMERALTTADAGDDPLYRAALTGWMSWLLLHPTGTLDEATRLAATEAEALATSLDHHDPAAVSVWGSLLLSAAVAAAREDDIPRAEEFLAEARIAANQLQELGYPIHRQYEVTFGRAQVVMQAVDIAVVTDRPGHAIDLSRGFLPHELPIAAQARHLTDRASAYTTMGMHDKAVQALLSIEKIAPTWLHHQRYPQTIIHELVEHERRGRRSQLRELAERIGALP